MYRDPFTAVVREMPATARTSEGGSRTLSKKKIYLYLIELEA